MKNWILCASLLGLPAAPDGQPAAKIAFEVASIKPAKPSPMGRMRIMMNADSAMLRYSNVSLKDCIRAAYRVKEYQVQGPDWIGSTRFDIVAKLPAGSSKDKIPEMLQSMLADRFQLALHRETKEHAIYALVTGKGGPKLKPAEAPAGEAAAGNGKPSPGGMPRGAMTMMMDPAGAHLKAPAASLATLAELISRFTERPVVDMTGIQGQYDFDLVFAPETMRGLPAPPGGKMMAPAGDAERQASDPPAAPAASIYDAVQRYGLKLEPRKGPMEVLVVDHIERAPSGN